jgi:hypothetical protein
LGLKVNSKNGDRIDSGKSFDEKTLKPDFKKVRDHMHYYTQPLQLTRIAIVFVCFALILVCDHFIKKQNKKTLQRIDCLLDKEQKDGGLKLDNPGTSLLNRKNTRAS